MFVFDSIADAFTLLGIWTFVASAVAAVVLPVFAQTEAGTAFFARLSAPKPQ